MFLSYSRLDVGALVVSTPFPGGFDRWGKLLVRLVLPRSVLGCHGAVERGGADTDRLGSMGSRRSAARECSHLGFPRAWVLRVPWRSPAGWPGGWPAWIGVGRLLGCKILWKRG